MFFFFIRFTKTMMYRLNHLRTTSNAAFGHYTFYTQQGLQIRFSYQAIMIDKNLSNRNNQTIQPMLKQIKGFVQLKCEIQN